jgi:hypothetical protein
VQPATTPTVPPGRPLPPLDDDEVSGEAAGVGDRTLTVRSADRPAERAVLVPAAAGLALMVWTLNGRVLARSIR